MLEIASPPMSALAQDLSLLGTTSHEPAIPCRMMQRYLKNPRVAKWLMHREPRFANSVHLAKESISYACVHYRRPTVPFRGDSYPPPRPILDSGQVFLRHTKCDNITLGTLFGCQEHHALVEARDEILSIPGLKRSIPNRRYSGRPRTRNFAADLGVKQLEVVEFAWMDDDSLIVACRRFLRGSPVDRKYVFSANFLFFRPIPPGCRNDISDISDYLYFTMNLRERLSSCDICSLEGDKSCKCLSSLRQPPRRCRSPSDAVIPVPDRSKEPSGQLDRPIGSWANYEKALFSRNEEGTFYIEAHWHHPSGCKMVYGPKYPVRYEFSCGDLNDTMYLLQLYGQRLCQRKMLADTFILGGGLSSRSDIARLMDKQDDKPQQPTEHVAPLECNESILRDDDMLSGAISEQTGIGMVFPQPTVSQGIGPSDGYGPILTGIEDTSVIPLGSRYSTDEGSLLSTGVSHDAPSSTTLIEGVDPLIGIGTSVPDMHDGRLDRSQQVVDNADNEWCDNPIIGPTIMSQPPQEPRLLPTRHPGLQRYMTVERDSARTPKCQKCGKTFLKRGNLSRHIQTTHLQLRFFKCPQCTSSFKHKTHLKRHQRSVHQRGRRFGATAATSLFRSWPR